MTPQTKAIAAATVGNGLEWVSFSAYALLADVIARGFFPSANPTLSLMLTFAGIGGAYFIRPLGAIVLGGYADRVGRLPALMISIKIMVAATFLITILPDYDTIGILAPIGMLIAILMQGFSAGGEFGSATAYLVEQNADRRGFMASWQVASQAGATLLVTLVVTLLSGVLEPARFDAWGWRIAFTLGLLLGPIGIYIRRNLQDSPEFTEVRVEQTRMEQPVRTVFATQKARMLTVIGVIAVSTAMTYLISYMPTFAIRQLGLPTSASFAATIFVGIILVVGSPLTGHLSDRFGRVRMMTIAVVLVFVASLPLFLLLRAYPSVIVLGLGLGFLGIVKVWYSGPLSALIAEVVPVRTRGTGLSISYNVAVAIFGGFTPLVITGLIATTGTSLAPAFWIMLLAVVSASAVLYARRFVNAPEPAAAAAVPAGGTTPSAPA